MLFKKVTEQHILDGIKDFNEKGIPDGFGVSSTYDVVYKGKKYPPKVVMAYANYRAEGRKIERYFKGGIGTDCFKVFDENGFEIKKKMENKIENYLKEFSEIADDWFKKEDWFEERFDFYQDFFTDDNLEKVEWKDFQEMGDQIHSFNMVLAKKRALGSINLPIEEYRRIFKYIASGKDPINITINNLYKNYDGNAVLPFFSDSSISELIAYAYPNKYVLYNRRDVKALEILGLKLEKVRAEKFGDKFLRYNELLQPVLEQYKEIVGKRTNTSIQLELDQFFSWLYETKKADAPIRDLINRYKALIKNKGLEEEKYKWEFIQKFKGKPDPNKDIREEINSIKFENLIYHLSISTLKEIANKDPKSLSIEFEKLKDNTTDLDQRILDFSKNTLKIYKTTNSKNSHHQDERSMSAYLTLINPAEYTFYKSSYYTDYCKYLDIKVGKPKRKYSHYLELIKELAEDYISKDEELISLLKDELGTLMDEDPNFLLTAQDMLFQLMGNEEGTNYWVFQGNPNHFKIKSSIQNNALKSWSVKAHMDKIKEGDKVIIWSTGNEAGCYALAEVKSDVYEGLNDENEMKYYIDETKNEKGTRVDISITHNLADSPITKTEIDEVKELAKLKGGNQGTNFTATKEEYDALLELSKEKAPDDEDRLVYRLSKIGKEDSLMFYHKLEELIHHLKLSLHDPKVCYNLPKGKLLGLTIGQKYALTINRVNRKNILHYIDTTSNNDNWYNEVNSFSELKEAEEAYTVSATNELEKTVRSGYTKSSSPALEKSIFDKNYKKYIFDLAFNNGLTIEDMNTPINTILYGPPGTGKTYSLKNKYFAKYTSKETSLTKEKQFENVVKECSWWQVIAIALLELGKTKVSNILENKWVQQKAKISSSKTIRPTLWGQLQSHTIETCEYVNVKSKQSPLIFNKDKDSYWEVISSEVQEQSPELYDIINSVENFNPNPDKEIKRYKFVTFHQSFSYEDFIEGIKPILPEGEEVANDLGYKIENGVFKELCIEASNDPKNKYAIFIDEINRGNVSAIFGELITLIETDKRTGCVNEISITLPYSKEEFSVPHNLDIYGTMNTADRSVEALDTALRRRFSFVEMMPEYTTIEDNEIGGVNLGELLKVINDRIEILIDRDHTIGHSYFIDISSKKELANAFNDKILPLLQEYFYGDYGKIGLVLGKGFVTEEKLDKISFANFVYDNQNEFKTPKFNLIKVNKKNIIDAIDLLMNKSSNVGQE